MLHVPPPIIFPREPLPAKTSACPRVLALHEGAKVPPCRRMDIVDVAIDVFCGLEAAFTLRARFGACVGFKMAAAWLSVRLYVYLQWAGIDLTCIRDCRRTI